MIAEDWSIVGSGFGPNAVTVFEAFPSARLDLLKRLKFHDQAPSPGANGFLPYKNAI